MANQFPSAGGGGIDPNDGDDIQFLSLSEGQVPKATANSTLVYGGATVDPATGKWVFDKAIEVPAGSLDLGAVLTATEGGEELTLVNNRTKEFGFALVSQFTDAGGAEGPGYWNFGPGNNFVVQPDDTQVITTNPLTFTLATDVVAPNNRLVDRATIRANGPMTNTRIRVVDNATGLVIRYIPDKLAWDTGTGGLDLVTGDNTFVFVSDDPDLPGVFNLGFVPFRVTPGMQYDITIAADNMDLLGDVLDFPYYANEQHDGQFVSMAGFGDVSGPGSSTQFSVPTFADTSGTILADNPLLRYESTAATSSLTIQESASGSADLFFNGTAGFAIGLIQTLGNNFVIECVAAGGQLSLEALAGVNVLSLNSDVDVHGALGVLLRSLNINVPPVTLEATGEASPQGEVYIDTASPEGVRTAQPGALSIVIDTVTPANNALYQLHSTVSANTPWVQIGGADPGYVVGPVASTIGAIPTYDVTTGDSVQDNPLLRYASSANFSQLILRESSTGTADILIKGTTGNDIGLIQSLGDDLVIDALEPAGILFLGGLGGVSINSLNGSVVIESNFTIAKTAGDISATLTSNSASDTASLVIEDSSNVTKCSLAYDESADATTLDLDTNLQLNRNAALTEIILRSANINNQSRIDFIDSATFSRLLIDSDEGATANNITSLGYDLNVNAGAELNLVVDGSNFVRVSSPDGGNTVQMLQLANAGLGGATVNIYTSTVNPEGVVPANRGDYCYYKAATDGDSALFIKESGADGTNTGWVDIISTSSGVTGPASSTVGGIAFFDVTTGKQIADNALFKTEIASGDTRVVLRSDGPTGLITLELRRNGGTPGGVLQYQEPFGQLVMSSADAMVVDSLNNLTVETTSGVLRVNAKSANALILENSGSGDVEVNANAGSIGLFNNHGEFVMDTLATAFVTATGVNFDITVTNANFNVTTGTGGVDITSNYGSLGITQANAVQLVSTATIELITPVSNQVIVKSDFTFDDGGGTQNEFGISVPVSNGAAAIRLKDELDSPKLNILYNDATNAATISTTNSVSSLNISAENNIDLVSTGTLDINVNTNVTLDATNGDIDIVSAGVMNYGCGDLYTVNAFTRLDLICGQFGTLPIINFSNSNTQFNLFAYFQTPIGNVVGEAGDVLVRNNSAASDVFVHRGAASESVRWDSLLGVPSFASIYRAIGAGSTQALTATPTLFSYWTANGPDFGELTSAFASSGVTFGHVVDTVNGDVYEVDATVVFQLDNNTTLNLQVYTWDGVTAVAQEILGRHTSTANLNYVTVNLSGVIRGPSSVVGSGAVRLYWYSPDAGNVTFYASRLNVKRLR